MDNVVLSLSVGLILGILIASGVWAVLLALVRSERKTARERNAALREITEECAEAEKIIAASSTGAHAAQGLGPALSPKVEKIRKALTVNMPFLDVYFIKYIEGCLANYQRLSAEGGEEKRTFSIDKYLSEPKQSPPSVVESAVKDIRSRIEKGIATAEEALPPKPKPITPAAKEPPVREKPAAVDVFDAETLIAAGIGKKPPAEPPAIDLRTGIITVEEDKEEKRPVEPRRKKEEKKPSPEIRPAVAEKTIQWDRSELLGLASKPEAIVVQSTVEIKPGATVRVQPKAEAVVPPSPPKPAVKEEKKPEEGKADMISGEDIVSKLDSFFGING
jgi:hypothetical protein